MYRHKFLYYAPAYSLIWIWFLMLMSQIDSFYNQSIISIIRQYYTCFPFIFAGDYDYFVTFFNFSHYISPIFKALLVPEK